MPGHSYVQPDRQDSSPGLGMTGRYDDQFEAAGIFLHTEASEQNSSRNTYITALFILVLKNLKHYHRSQPEALNKPFLRGETASFKLSGYTKRDGHGSGRSGFFRYSPGARPVLRRKNS